LFKIINYMEYKLKSLLSSVTILNVLHDINYEAKILVPRRKKDARQKPILY